MNKHPKYGFEMISFWDSFEGAYQMGAQKHRLYMLDLLHEKGARSLFDVGCGTGPIFELLLNDGMDVTIPTKRWPFFANYKGTDYSEAMIRIAKDMFPEYEHLFEVQDARKLKEQDNSWDAVILMHALDHLDDYQAAIKEAARVSKKYVCIILWRSFVGEGTRLNDRNTMGKKEGEEPWKDTYLQEYSREALENEFKKNNLSIIHIAEGEAINSDQSHYNFLYLLEKI